MADDDRVVINLATGLEDAERVTVALLVGGARLRLRAACGPAASLRRGPQEWRVRPVGGAGRSCAWAATAPRT